MALRPPPRPLWPWLLERVDDAGAVEIVEPRQVFGVERLDAGFDTRSEDERVPEGGSSGEMELFGASQVGIAGQHKGQEILKLTEAIPGVRRGEPLLAELSRGREEFAGDLPQEYVVLAVGDEVVRDLLTPWVSLIAGVDQDVGINGRSCSSSRLGSGPSERVCIE